MTIYQKISNSLITKFLFSVGAALLISLSLWGSFNIKYVEDKFTEDLGNNVDRLSNTIRLGTHYAMMTNSRDDIQQIIHNIARQNDIENIRIYNKLGQIKYSNHPEELDRKTNIKAEACYICHKTDPPTAFVSQKQRVRIFKSQKGYRLMGIISPVYNEAGCASDKCHVHPPDKKVLGALDLVVSLKDVDQEIAAHQCNFFILATVLFCSTAGIMIFIFFRFVSRPIHQLIRGARSIEQGDYASVVRVDQKDEMQELADAINQMGRAIGEKTRELNKQRDEYQSLFEMVPCIITVQDLDYRLIGYNREFGEKFDPHPGDYCYQVYKGRDRKCIVCPVEKTFADGRSHYSEEAGFDKDGTPKHWIVRTSPIKDADGRIVAAMEMNLDITQRKQLEEKLEQSERKYHSIFNNIPNPVFVLAPDTLEILDCNDSVEAVYDYQRKDLLGTSFTQLFWDSQNAQVVENLKSMPVIERAKHRRADSQLRYVTIRVSPSEYGGQQVLLVTISDITKRLEAEQQLIQASKMATLGEMATGVAHELNQPLSVIKTASNFFMRKIRNGEPIKENILLTMAEEIDSHVQRAAKIIGHMRQFGRKSEELNLGPVQINDVLKQAMDIFSQQLKVRGIDVLWQIDAQLPEVTGDPGRLEQVMINLLINARDAIEEKSEQSPGSDEPKQIRISTRWKHEMVEVEVCDTGAGIPDSYLDKIFEPFFTTKKVGQGTGLGLSISYGIIQECGGRIFACPNEGGGACFVIQFPTPKDGHV